jgi:hypothetical protein
MSGSAVGGPLTIAVDPRNDQYDPHDERWLDQVTSLYRELAAEVAVVREGRPVPGTKGVVDHVTIALSSAGAFQAAVMCFRAWLGRDRDRRIHIRWDDGGVERSVVLTGDAVDAETVREIARAATGQWGGPPWPAGTEHS